MEKENLSTNIIIREATEDDAENLLKIYSYYVEETAITFEYEVPSVAEFAGRIRKTKEKYPYIVAQDKNTGRLLGYSYASAFKERAAYQWSVETTIYVDKDCKRGGLGRLLYAELEKCLSAMGILNVNACIGYPNGAEDEHLTYDSVKFHEKLGYSMVGEFHQCGSKFGRWYNMVWMEKMLGEHVDNPKELF
ncbi:GNAT family N-acetyltransferase [Butyrivibrio sp. MC2021]|uniref:GNAT family N-acetyltransferase n=1 Tax=Butyrivibrio sp. MC2021 TaxID=1408306 RepID=UPI00056A99C6|nr:GNAT family N-acetyltransferase [Butyrivibrio sp. MC2021]